ncbi:MAG: alpha/beta hydrolase [Deltaproteobacteria bacterium]|nr:alpha/beta hydrolase [Deltaproteobacteria bacterium]
MAQAAADAFYFGSPEGSLFGCYHPPHPARRRSCAVVLCYPLGHEYIAAHRAFRQMAVLLSQAGFPVLRFDYYGCGDSRGDERGWRIARWLADIGGAIVETRRRSGIAKVYMIGLRFGATLSMMAGAQRGDIDGIVLWEPVISGKSYMGELESVHQDFLERSSPQPAQLVRKDGTTEIFGFPFSEYMLTDLANVDLLAIHKKPANAVLIAAAGADDLRHHLEATAATVDYQCLSNPTIWMEGIERVVVPHQILRSVISWISAMAG